MAEGVRLQLTFETMAGTRSWSFSRAKPSSGLVAVKNLGATMITNGSIFENQPLRLTAAKEVVTSENVYDLDE